MRNSKTNANTPFDSEKEYTLRKELREANAQILDLQQRLNKNEQKLCEALRTERILRMENAALRDAYSLSGRTRDLEQEAVTHVLQ